MKIFEFILNCTQPLAFLSFLIAGICCLFLEKWHQAAINLCITATNFFIFYGNKVFEK